MQNTLYPLKMAHNSPFTKGLTVEVSSNEEGLRGSWFSATILRPPSKHNKIYLEYTTLVEDQAPCKNLREFVDVVDVRPVPPREVIGSVDFEISDEVDAWYDDGWWEGIVTKVKEEGVRKRYVLYFRRSREEIEFGVEELRVHREWNADGDWVPPLEVEPVVVDPVKVREEEKEKKEERQKDKEEEEKAAKSNSLLSKAVENTAEGEVKFSEGSLVEVSSDEEGFIGAWFTAKVVGVIANDKFLVEYDKLMADDNVSLLREEADVVHIRPTPPESQILTYKRLQEVDALHNDGWWVGVVSKVLRGPRYIVYFKETNEEYEFPHSDVRPHQDWLNGEWVTSSSQIMAP